jgi:hypothetical protein
MSSKGSIAAKKRVNAACRAGTNRVQSRREYIPPFLRQYEPPFEPVRLAAEPTAPALAVVHQTDKVVVVEPRRTLSRRPSILAMAALIAGLPIATGGDER